MRLNQTKITMKNKDEILNQVRIKYNKSLTEEETLKILRRNHDEPIISPDECYLAMEYYAEQKLNIHGVGGPVSDVRSEGEQLGNEAGATKPVRRFENCYISNKIGCHCTDECGYDALMRGISDEGQP